MSLLIVVKLWTEIMLVDGSREGGCLKNGCCVTLLCLWSPDNICVISVHKIGVTVVLLATIPWSREWKVTSFERYVVVLCPYFTIVCVVLEIVQETEQSSPFWWAISAKAPVWRQSFPLVCLLCLSSAGVMIVHLQKGVNGIFVAFSWLLTYSFSARITYPSY